MGKKIVVTVLLLLFGGIMLMVGVLAPDRFRTAVIQPLLRSSIIQPLLRSEALKPYQSLIRAGVVPEVNRATRDLLPSGRKSHGGTTQGGTAPAAVAGAATAGTATATVAAGGAAATSAPASSGQDASQQQLPLYDSLLPPVPLPQKGDYTIQVGLFTSGATAAPLDDKIQAMGIATTRVETVDRHGDYWVVLTAGSFTTPGETQGMRMELAQALNLPSPLPLLLLPPPPPPKKGS